MQNMEGLIQPSKCPSPILLSSGRHQPQHPLRTPSTGSSGQGRARPPHPHSTEENRIPVGAEDPQELPQYKELSLDTARWGCSAFMSLLSWEGGEQQHLRACRAGRRKEKSFQESVWGEAASAGALGRSLQQLSPPGASGFLMVQFTKRSPQIRSPLEARCAQCPSLGVSQDPAAQILPAAQSLMPQLLIQARN